VIRPLPAMSYIKNWVKLNKLRGSSHVLSKMHLLYIRVNSYSLIQPSRSSSTSQIHWSTSGLLYGNCNSVRILITSFLSNLSLGLRINKLVTGFDWWFIIEQAWNWHWWLLLYHHISFWRFFSIFMLRCFVFPFHRLVIREIFIEFSFYFLWDWLS